MIDCIDPTFLVSFDNVEVNLELLKSIFKIVLARIVNHKRYRQYIESALMADFTVLCHVLIESVFLCDAVMKLEVVDDGFLTMFVEEIEFDEV